MDINKKFLFINPAASNEDNARTFPVASLQAMHMVDLDDMNISFDDAASADHTIAKIRIKDNLTKSVMRDFVEAINFSKDSVVVLADQSNDTSVSPNIDFSGAISFEEGAAGIVSSLTVTGNIASVSGTFAINDGGAVTQTTSRATPVTSDNHTGKITTHNASLADATAVTFQVNCSDVTTTDLVILNHISGGTAGEIEYAVTAVAEDSFKITYKNVSGSASTSQFVFRYALITGSDS